MELSTKDSLVDILLETVAITEDPHGVVLLILHDGTVWSVVWDVEDGDLYYLVPTEFAQC